MLQEEAQAAYTALQVAEDRATSLQTQLEAAPLEAAAAANHKACNSFYAWWCLCLYRSSVHLSVVCQSSNFAVDGMEYNCRTGFCLLHLVGITGCRICSVPGIRLHAMDHA